MPVENWSDSILLGKLSDDPEYTDDLNALLEQCTQNNKLDVLLDFSNISYLNSSNIARLLRLRRLVATKNSRKLVLCGITPHVWGVFLVTGLDKIFECFDDVPSGLASIQLPK